MTEYFPELYCQEVWDLGRSVMFFNRWIINTYYEDCDPKLTRRFYNFIKTYLNAFSEEIDEYEYDNSEQILFNRYTQNTFQKMVRLGYQIMAQMPKRELVAEYFENILINLRVLNTYLDSPSSELRDWIRIHYDYEQFVINQLWSSEEIFNMIPNANIIAPNQNS